MLLDADGVVQAPTQNFEAVLRSLVGESAGAWLMQTFRPDGPVIIGRSEVLPLLAGLLRRSGSAENPDAVYERLWQGIEVHEEVLAQAERWRLAGLTVYLATNQDPGRARYMKRTLGYQRRLDGAYYSCDLGIGKPDPRFFERVLDDLGAEPGNVVFVDDGPANVEAARRLGLHGVQWAYGDSLQDLARAVVA